MNSNYVTHTTLSRNCHDEQRNAEIDLALAVMCAIARPGQRFSCRVIAEITGMSHAGAFVIEKRALMKIRKKAAALRSLRE